MARKVGKQHEVQKGATGAKKDEGNAPNQPQMARKMGQQHEVQKRATEAKKMTREMP